MNGLPVFELPVGYRFVTYKTGDEIAWAEIEYSAGEFPSLQEALDRFNLEFLPHTDDMEDRCFFVETADGRKIGTGTAWYNPDFMGEIFGQVHWISLHPDFHGRGIGKAIVSRVMQRLTLSHDKAYLRSSTKSFAAINIYLAFGFIPLPGTPDFDKAWKLIHEAITARSRQ